METGYYGLSLLEVMYRRLHIRCAKLQDVLMSFGSLVCLMPNTCVCHCLWYSSFRCLTPTCRIVYTLPFFLIFIINFFAGDASNQVHMEGYGVSNQCMALVRDNCLIPTKDAPELGYIRESTDKQYVPDVYYKVSAWHYY